MAADASFEQQQRTSACLACGASFEYFIDVADGGQNRHYCDTCPAILAESAKDLKQREYSGVYIGENNGIGEYVRSKSHYNELVKEKKLRPVG